MALVERTLEAQAQQIDNQKQNRIRTIYALPRSANDMDAANDLWRVENALPGQVPDGDQLVVVDNDTNCHYLCTYVLGNWHYQLLNAERKETGVTVSQGAPGPPGEPGFSSEVD